MLRMTDLKKVLFTNIFISIYLMLVILLSSKTFTLTPYQKRLNGLSHLEHRAQAA